MHMRIQSMHSYECMHACSIAHLMTAYDRYCLRDHFGSKCNTISLANFSPTLVKTIRKPKNFTFETFTKGDFDKGDTDDDGDNLRCPDRDKGY